MSALLDVFKFFSELWPEGAEWDDPSYRAGGSGAGF